MSSACTSGRNAARARHRRYPLAEVERYLRRTGVQPATSSTVSRVPPTLPAVELAEGARAALRRLAVGEASPITEH